MCSTSDGIHTYELGIAVWNVWSSTRSTQNMSVKIWQRFRVTDGIGIEDRQRSMREREKKKCRWWWATMMRGGWRWWVVAGEQQWRVGGSGWRLGFQAQGALWLGVPLPSPSRALLYVWLGHRMAGPCPKPTRGGVRVPTRTPPLFFQTKGRVWVRVGTPPSLLSNCPRRGVLTWTTPHSGAAGQGWAPCGPRPMVVHLWGLTFRCILDFP
jgi:hypothetical protein